MSTPKTWARCSVNRSAPAMMANPMNTSPAREVRKLPSVLRSHYENGRVSTSISPIQHNKGVRGTCPWGLQKCIRQATRKETRPIRGLAGRKVGVLLAPTESPRRSAGSSKRVS
jgi:hypothetical protein